MIKKILLTGATGFLGSHLLESFVSQNYQVIVLKRKSSNTVRIEHIYDKIISFDIEDSNFDLIFEKYKPEIVVHTACNYGRNGESAREILSTNLSFGIEILEKSIAWKVRSFINTDTALPSNLNYYSKSKAYFRDWLEYESLKIQVLNIRLEHLYGVNDDSKKFIPWLINNMIYSTDKIKLTSGVQKRDFIYISDVVEAFNILLNAKIESNWNTFDLSSNNLIAVEDIIKLLAEKVEKKFKLNVKDKLIFGAIPYRVGEEMNPIMNNSQLLNLGWKPKVDISQGLDLILKNYK